MDLLFSKYASPFSLLDVVIESNGLSEFIVDFFKLHEDRSIWEVWLHKIYDKSFNEFKKSVFDSVQNDFIPKEQLETTINDSKSILNTFIPEERG